MFPLSSAKPKTKKCVALTKGFTLIEVLVALFIVSLTLVSAFKASGTLTQSSERQKSGLFAQLCVDNYLSGMRLSGTLPSVGVGEVDCSQNNQIFTLHVSIDVTPNPSFRRVEAQVFTQDTPILRVTTVVGAL